MDKKNKEKWYNNPSVIVNMIIVFTLLIIVVSQSFAIKSDINGFKMFSDVLNHNIIYILLFFYFLCLKFKHGKKYFNYLNIGLIIIYFIELLASIFTIVQSFTLVSLLTLILNFLLVIYLIHTLLRDTRLWEELKLKNSLFNDISNAWYFNAITFIAIFILVINLMFVSVFDGIILALFDCLFTILFGRYIYLYRVHLIDKNSKKNADGEVDTLDEFIEMAQSVVRDIDNKRGNK